MAADDRWWGVRARLQVADWKGDRQVKVISPLPDRPTPGPEVILEEVERLRADGIRRVLTSALHHGELAPFEQAGFETHERLHLLRHDLRDLPEFPADVRLRRAWRRDLTEVLALDAEAFDEFWTMDQQGIEDAQRATPAARFRVASTGRLAIGGYAITGRSGSRGYLQRLAVSPARHRHGLGTALVVDSLRWLVRSRATVAMVNTQERNEAALALYLATGFRSEPHGLTVLRRDLVP